MARKTYRSFVFGETLANMIEAMDESDQLRYFKYIKDYGLYSREPELAGVERAAWVSMKALLDNLNDRRGAPGANINARRAPEPASATQAYESTDDTASIIFAAESTDAADDTEGTESTESTDDTEGTESTESTDDTEGTKGTISTISTKGTPEGTKGTKSTISTKGTENSPKGTKGTISTKGTKGTNLYIYNNLNLDSDSDSDLNLDSRVKNFKESTGPPDYPPDYPPDFAQEFQKLVLIWNDEGRKVPLPPFRRDFFSLNTDQREIFMRARQDFSGAEITNAVKNYQFVRDNPQTYSMAHNYASVFTFLEKGVGTFYRDESIDPQFLRKGGKNGP